MEFLLQQQWHDPRLKFSNYSDIHFEYLNAIHHSQDIWLPDTYFIMHGDFKDPIVPMHFALRIYRNGTINYLMRFVMKFSTLLHHKSFHIYKLSLPSLHALINRRHLILSCQGRLNIFPFDDPLCSFSVESSKYMQSSPH